MRLKITVPVVRFRPWHHARPFCREPGLSAVEALALLQSSTYRLADSQDLAGADVVDEFEQGVGEGRQPGGSMAKTRAHVVDAFVVDGRAEAGLQRGPDARQAVIEARLVEKLLDPTAPYIGATNMLIQIIDNDKIGPVIFRMHWSIHKLMRL